jgi:hypothetical protein
MCVVSFIFREIFSEVHRLNKHDIKHLLLHPPPPPRHISVHLIPVYI